MVIYSGLPVRPAEFNTRIVVVWKPGHLFLKAAENEAVMVTRMPPLDAELYRNKILARFTDVSAITQMPPVKIT